jgi:hypothetical protein
VTTCLPCEIDYQPRGRVSGANLEREMGVEPTTTCLEGRGSTTELLPPKSYLF